jgi:carboxyl-terminal processing protease
MRFNALLGLIALTAIVFGQGQQQQQQQPPTKPPAETTGTPPDKTSTLDAKVKADVLAELETVVTKRAFVPGVDFSKWPEFISKRKDDIDKADSETALTRTLNNALREFGVSHITFRTPRAAQARQSGTTTGLGMSVKKTDAGLEVTSVLPLGPAGQVGIEVGDVIKEVEHRPATETSAIQVDAGKSVVVTLVKKTGGEPKELTLEAKSFATRRPETLTWIGDDAAVLKIWTFSTGYDRKNIEALVTQANAKAKYLVIDLRSNGGGAVANLNHFLSLLIPDGTPVGTFLGRSVVDDYLKEHPEGKQDPLAIAAWAPRKFKTNKREVTPFTGKIAVLINRGSASASEICSAALKDCRDAVLVGGNSRGAVLASVYARLPGGFELQYPIQDYVTIKGERLEANPRVVDLEVKPSTDGKDDTPQKAIDLMKKKTAEHASTDHPGGHG